MYVFKRSLSFLVDARDSFFALYCSDNCEVQIFKFLFSHLEHVID